LLKESENSTKSKIDYLKPNETKDFEFNFGLNRGDELLYRYLVIPPTRKVEVSNVAYRDVNETRIVTIFDTVRHEVVKPVVREVQVC
jgi:hypothetical protein